MEITIYRQRDSAAIIVCTKCGVNNWADKEVYDRVRARKAWLVCNKCGALCEFAKAPSDLPEPITANNLDCVALPSGLTAANASDEEFDAWAKNFVKVAKNDDGLWTLEQRADLCDALLLRGKITVQSTTAQ